MAEEKTASVENPETEEATFFRPAFPTAQFPVIFADGVMSMAVGRGMVKFYLYRSDPHFLAQGSQINMPFCQIVMPTDAFAATAIFFEERLKAIIKSGAITEESVQQLRHDLAGHVAETKDVIE